MTQGKKLAWDENTHHPHGQMLLNYVLDIQAHTTMLSTFAIAGTQPHKTTSRGCELTQDQEHGSNMR